MPRARLRNPESIVPYKFGGNELYTDSGLNMYDFKARMYDPTIGRFTSIDPKAEKYFSISPYAYCNNNPVIFVDPDGKVVRLAGKKELEMIRNTVRRDERPFIVANENGEIDFNSMKSQLSPSYNFTCLLNMVKNDQTISVSLSDSFSYVDKKGHLYENGALSYFGPDEELADPHVETVSGLSSGESGNYGKTLFPDRGGSQNSSSSNIEIYIHPSLSPLGSAEAFSHEGYGHALLYLQNGHDHDGASHQFIGMYDINTLLKTMILTARKETINNQ